MKRSASVEYICDVKKMLEDPTLEDTFKENRMTRCLPTEVLLNIVHCVDFNTLVALCFTSHAFHGVVQTNAGILAKRRRMGLVIEQSKVFLYGGKTGLELRYDPSMPFTYILAMRRVASQVGFHNLARLRIRNDWRRVPMDRLLYAAPALRFVETLHISIAELKITSVDDVNRFTEQFPRLRLLCLAAARKGIFDWPAFLRSEGALKLPELVVGILRNFSKKDGSSVPGESDFVRYCFDWTQLAEGVGKFVSLPFDLDVSDSFLETSLKRIAKADRTITVQFRMADEPKLSADKFSVEQMEEYGRTVIHYKSRSSSVSVYKVDGSFTVTNDPSFDPFI
ncbi:hypothetical protein AAVH_10993 [Aphelenchoides avenae]|nr:hypothetical protein AAVH_10993 [Aphelenchus avenae]